MKTCQNCTYSSCAAGCKANVMMLDNAEKECEALRDLVELIFASTLPYNNGEPTFSDKVTDMWKEMTPNAKSQATDAALSRQVACTDGLGVAVPSAPTFDQGDMK